MHGPFMKWLIEQVRYEDPLLLKRCQQGFQFVGQFDPCVVDTQPGGPSQRQSGEC